MQAEQAEASNTTDCHPVSPPPGPQVVSYEVSGDGRWALLTGVTKIAGETTTGLMHLYSLETSCCQQLQGRAGCFASIKLHGRTAPTQVLVFEEQCYGEPCKLVVKDLGGGETAPADGFHVQPQPIHFPCGASADYPISMSSAPGQDIVFMITRLGYLLLFDIHTGRIIYSASRTLTVDPLIDTRSTYHAAAGLLAVTSCTGKVLQIKLDEQALLPYILEVLGDKQLALQIGARLNLPGAPDLYLQEFQELLSAGDTGAAVNLAAKSPPHFLRTEQTMAFLKQVPTAATASDAPPLFSYLMVLLRDGHLNESETTELVQLVRNQAHVNEWLSGVFPDTVGRLADLLFGVDARLALPIYTHGRMHEQATYCLLELGLYNEIVAYAEEVAYAPRYASLLRILTFESPPDAVDFAILLVAHESGPLIETEAVVDLLLLERGLVTETTAFLQDALMEDKEEEADLQTLLLELLLTGPDHRKAEAILIEKSLTRYNRLKIAGLCEAAGLYDQALLHYPNPRDIKRVMMVGRAAGMNVYFVITFLGKLEKRLALECMDQLLASNMPLNLQLVVQAANLYSDKLGHGAIHELFERANCIEGLVGYLSNRFNCAPQVRDHAERLDSS